MSDSFEKAFKQSVDGLHFSSGSKEKIYHRLVQAVQTETKREGNFMKKRMIPRAAAVTAACLMLTGITAFAGSKITAYVSSSNGYYDYDEASEMAMGKIDFPEEIGSGYKFDGGNDVNVKGVDDGGNTVDNRDDLHAAYVNDKGDKINLAMSYGSYGEDDDRTPTETRIINGITVAYDYDEYLFLPPKAEYETLDPDVQERLDNDDHFFVSYGTDDVETNFFSGATFEKDNIHYHIYSMDDVSAEELFMIAGELINR